jgi:hypothetical protein
LPTVLNAAMPLRRNDSHSNSSSDHNYHRRKTSPSMPVRASNVPLLANQHRPPLNFARQHHTEQIPHHNDPGYARYRTNRNVVFSNGVKVFEAGLSSRSPVEHIVLQDEKLIVQYHSQSKLSQQELADLQKATHFDKKELQQWYKGTAERTCQSCHGAKLR